jgi:predicted transcriptional regulator
MPSTLKQSLQKLTKEKAPGPSPSFSTFHLLLAVELMSEKSVGRNKLAQELDIGEGAARTLIGRLKDAGLISTSKSGCSLTDRGLKLWKDYQSTIKKVKIEKNELTFADHNVAILVKNSGDKVKTGMEQRDAAVMAGAKSATTILFKKGRLVFPSPIRDVDKDFPKAATQIVKLLKPQDNDVIVVVSSESSGKAEYAALAAAWTLLDNNQ